MEMAARHGLQVVLWPDRYSQGVTLTNPASYLQEPLLSEMVKFIEKHGPVKDLREYPQFARTCSREQATKISTMPLRRICCVTSPSCAWRRIIPISWPT